MSGWLLQRISRDSKQTAAAYALGFVAGASADAAEAPAVLADGSLNLNKLSITDVDVKGKRVLIRVGVLTLDPHFPLRP
jgi:hypothetical protein